MVIFLKQEFVTRRTLACSERRIAREISDVCSCESSRYLGGLECVGCLFRLAALLTQCSRLWLQGKIQYNDRSV